jgi:ParB-like chromosome segregation protein Spo0J
MITVTEIDVDRIEVGEHHQPVLKLVDQLVEDIAANGLEHPLVVRQVGNRLALLFGRNRVEACRRLGHSTVPVVIVRSTVEIPRARQAWCTPIERATS